MGKIAFSNEVFKEAVVDVKAALNTLSGRSRKLIVLDLDECCGEAASARSDGKA